MGNSPRSGSHGGMWRWRVAFAIFSARFTASAYVNKENGATSPGRWHDAQLANRIGAMSLLNVTAADGGDERPQPAAAKAASNAIPIRCFTRRYYSVFRRGAAMSIR